MLRPKNHKGGKRAKSRGSSQTNKSKSIVVELDTSYGCNNGNYEQYEDTPEICRKDESNNDIGFLLSNHKL